MIMFRRTKIKKTQVIVKDMVTRSHVKITTRPVRKESFLHMIKMLQFTTLTTLMKTAHSRSAQKNYPAARYINSIERCNNYQSVSLCLDTVQSTT